MRYQVVDESMIEYDIGSQKKRERDLEYRRKIKLCWHWRYVIIAFFSAVRSIGDHKSSYEYTRGTPRTIEKNCIKHCRGGLRGCEGRRNDLLGVEAFLPLLSPVASCSICFYPSPPTLPVNFISILNGESLPRMVFQVSRDLRVAWRYRYR